MSQTSKKILGWEEYPSVVHDLSLCIIPISRDVGWLAKTAMTITGVFTCYLYGLWKHLLLTGPQRWKRFTATVTFSETFPVTGSSKKRLYSKTDINTSW